MKEGGGGEEISVMWKLDTTNSLAMEQEGIPQKDANDGLRHCSWWSTPAHPRLYNCYIYHKWISLTHSKWINLLPSDHENKNYLNTVQFFTEDFFEVTFPQVHYYNNCITLDIHNGKQIILVLYLHSNIIYYWKIQNYQKLTSIWFCGWHYFVQSLIQTSNRKYIYIICTRFLTCAQN